MTQRTAGRSLAALAAALLGAAALAGCSSSPSSSGSTTTTTGASRSGAATTTTLVASQLKALSDLLLVPADLGPGWVLTSSGPLATPTGPPATTTCEGSLAAVAQPGATVGTLLSDGTTRQVSQQLVQYPTTHDAAVAYRTAVDRLASCGPSIPGYPTKATYTVKPLPFASVGDQSTAYVVTTTSDGGSLSSDLVLGRQGRLIATVSLEPSATDPAQLTAAAQKAFAKLPA